MAPPVTIAKPASGVLPIPAIQMQSSGSNVRTPAVQTRSKVVIRRLAPGLTQEEFQENLGEDWTPGKGRVDWMLFRPGKVSKDLSKPSRPARVYLQVSNQTHLEILAEKVRSTTFTDVRNTAGDTVLIGPPTLEFAPYGRVPANKRRNDARQGLIDQDPEFIQFLESLTNPITKPATADANTEILERKDPTITVTPLIQHLRDKKAAKEAAKEKSSAAKAAKHTRQSSKNENVESKGETDLSAPVTKDAMKSPDKKQTRASKAEKATKIVTRPAKSESAAVESKAQPTPRGSPQVTKAMPEVTKPVADTSSTKKSDGVNPGAAAARMLQRDLGLRGGRGASSRRGGIKQGAEQNRAATAATNTATQTPSVDRQSVAAPTAAKSGNLAASTSSSTATVTTTTDGPSQSPTVSKPPAAPAIMKRTVPNKPPPAASGKSNVKPTIASTSTSTAVSNTSTVPSVSTNAPSPSSPAQPAAPVTSTPPTHLKPTLSTSTSTKAFLKHANPSQGITEPLLLTALSAFGPVTSVEIDKRKGFAYVEFAEPDGLRKAIAGSPVKIAQGSVQVLERKDRVSSTPAAGRGGASTASSAGTAAAGAAPGPGPGTVAGPGVGRGASPARGGGSGPARGGQGVSGQHTQQQQQSGPQQQQQQQQQQQPQPYRGGRGGGGGRGRGGLAKGGASATTAPAPLASNVSTTVETSLPASTTAMATKNDPVPLAAQPTSTPTPASEHSTSISTTIKPPPSTVKVSPAIAAEPAPVEAASEQAASSTTMPAALAHESMSME